MSDLVLSPEAWRFCYWFQDPDNRRQPDLRENGTAHLSELESSGCLRRYTYIDSAIYENETVYQASAERGTLWVRTELGSTIEIPEKYRT